MIINKLKVIDNLESDACKESHDNIDAMKKDMKDLLNILSIDSSIFKTNDLDNRLNTYLATYNRLVYSEVSVFVYALYSNQDQKLSDFMSNLEKVLDTYLANDKNVSKEKTKIILKLWDHVNLATKQYSELKLKDEIFHNKLQPYINDLNKNKEELENTKKDIFTQLISIVSIFVAISFVMFGGMTLLNELFDFTNMTSIPVIELACLGSLIGIIMISVIYAFIIFALRLSFREFGGKSPFRRTYLLSIASLFVIFMFTFMLWIIDISETSSVIPVYAPWIVLLIFILFIVYIWNNDLKNQKK